MDKHLTWSRLLAVFNRVERPGRWVLDLPLTLIGSCAECRAHCGDLLELLDAGEIPEEVTHFELAVIRSHHQARKEWQAFKDRSPQMIRQQLKRAPASYGMVDLLVEESHRQASIDRAAAHPLAEAAVEMAHRLPVRLPGDEAPVGPQEEEPLDPAARAELLALAYAVLGNAQRVADRDWDADTTFLQARAYLEEAHSCVPLFHAKPRVLSMWASLLTDTRRFPEALRALEAASELVKDDERAPASLAAEIAINQSLVLGLAGEDHAAIQPIRELLDAKLEALPPRLRLFVHHRLAEQLVYAGHAESARSLFPQVQGFCAEVGRGLDALRVRWLEGRILCAEEHHLEALEILSELQEDFLRREALHEAALVALEIAGVLLALDRPQEAIQHAREALTLFLPLRLSREMRSALALLAKAAERQTLSRRLVTALLRYAQGGPLPAEVVWT